MHDRIQTEIARARQAQAEGNEGMARVCARRAAGWTVKAYLEGRAPERAALSAIDNLRTLHDADESKGQLKEVLGHLLRPLEKDDPQGESYWPLDVDLVAEAEWLYMELLGGESGAD